MEVSHNTSTYLTSVKIIQLNEYGCRDAPCEKSWKQGNPLSNTVKPPKRGHFGTVAFVLSSEVVLLSEVAPFLLLNPIQCV